jgi:DNA-binding SARP family transcriptional activator
MLPMAARMEFGLLGPLIVRIDDAEITVRPGKQRAVLAVLLLNANQVVPVEELADMLWGPGRPPPSERVTVRNYVKRLRHALRDGDRARIATQPRGYLIRVQVDELDLARFEDLLAKARRAAREASWHQAAEQSRAALSLWRGEPLADVESEVLVLREIPRLLEIRLQALETRMEADLHLGRHADLIIELQALTRAHPLREHLHAMLMVAFYRCNRQAEALAVYQEARRALVEELGAEPGTELRALHGQVLAGDPVLAIPEPRPPTTGGAQALVVRQLSARARRPAARDGRSPGAARSGQAGGQHGLRAAGRAGEPGCDDGGPGGRTRARAVRADTPPGGAEAPHRAAGALLDLIVPRQLPAVNRDFVGRAAELTALTNLIEDAGEGRDTVVIAAISGTAGVGKTALAVRWAHQVAGRFPDGQLYLDLRGFGPASPIAPAAAVCGFLQALGVPPARIPAQPDAQVGLYRSLLADKRMLVALDNASDAAQVGPLLPAGPGCVALVTSRNPLTGLAVAHGARLVSLDVLAAGDARDLLAVRLGAERLAGEPAAAEALVELTAGLPLALSIAAARATAHPAFPLATLAAELRDARGRLEALAGGDPSADVRAAISWSYRRLNEPAARMFRLLGIHPGPDVTVAAAANLSGATRTATRRALAELVAGGLVTEHAPGRFACHDLLRVYAVELSQDCDSSADRRQALARLLDHYLHTAHAATLVIHAAAEPVPLAPLSSGVHTEEVATIAEAIAWFSAEHQVLLSACGAAAQAGFDSHAWQLPLVMVPYLSRSGHWLDWVTTLQTGLAAAHRARDDRAQAWVHRRLGQAHAFIGNYEDAGVSMRAALRTFCSLGDRASLAYTHTAAAVMREKQQCYRESLSHARRALVLFRACGHQLGEALALNGIGWDQVLLGDYPAALANSQEALRLCRNLGDQTLTPAVWDSLGLTYFRLGQHADATSCYEQAISEYLASGQRTGAAASFEGLGDVHRQVGDLTAAADAWRQALEILTELHHPDADSTKAKLRSLER